MNLKQSISQVQSNLDSAFKKQFSIDTSRLQTFSIGVGGCSPLLINTKGTREAIYKSNGLVFIPETKDELYLFDEIDKGFLEDDDELIFWVGQSYFHVAKKDEFEKYEANRKALLKAKEDVRSLHYELADLEHKLEVEDFWKQYDIPFSFQIDIKTVLSGLRANSWGDGSKSNTKYHVVLKEDATVGRTKRTKGQFLCTQPTGKHHYDFHEEKGVKLSNIISCNDCLKKIEKFKMQDI